MKFIRWLFSNIILIAFVLALTYAYVYWDNLTGEDTPAGKLIAYLSTEYDEVREFMEDYDLAGSGTAEVSETVSPPDVTETATAPAPASVPQVSMPPRQQLQPAPQPEAPPQAMLQAPPRQAYRPVYPEMQEPAMRQPGAQPFPEQAMVQPLQPPRPRPQMPPMPAVRESAPVTGAARPMSVPGDDLSSAEPVSSPRELWISAREEYHRGNIDVSIRNYKEVIASSSDNYDAYGELGNVYLSRGSHREAAEAYFEAASILVKLGHVGRARSLLPMLGRLDRAKAEELNQLIHNATS